MQTITERNMQASIEDYAEFLNTLPFTHYATFTTAYEMTLPSARRNMERFHDRMKKGGESLLFWVAEKFEVKDGYHTHGLIQIPDRFSFSNVTQIWQEVSGGLKTKQRNRIQLDRYDPSRGANYYVGKYIRRRNTDYDLLT